MLLSESLGNINCRTTMIAHISDSAANFMETLTTVQLASRIHRMRKKKSKVLHLLLCFTASLKDLRENLDNKEFILYCVILHNNTMSLCFS